jgi:hypothetical protein
MTMTDGYDAVAADYAKHYLDEVANKPILGSELRHLDDWWDHAVSLDFRFYERAPGEDALTGAGLVVDTYLERRPYPHEVETRRAYLLARRPG